MSHADDYHWFRDSKGRYVPELPRDEKRIHRHLAKTVGLRVYWDGIIEYDPQHGLMLSESPRSSGDVIEGMIHEFSHWIAATVHQRARLNYGLPFPSDDSPMKRRDYFNNVEVRACLIEFFIYSQAQKFVPPNTPAWNELKGIEGLMEDEPERIHPDWFVQFRHAARNIADSHLAVERMVDLLRALP